MEPFRLLFFNVFTYTKDKTMTNFHVTIIDEHDCNSVADDYIIEAVDRADAELRLLEAYGDFDYIQVSDVVDINEL